MQTQSQIKAQARRAELFEALAGFEREADMGETTAAKLRELRAALLREEAGDGRPKQKLPVVYSEPANVAGREGDERISTHYARKRVLLRPLSVRAA